MTPARLKLTHILAGVLLSALLLLSWTQTWIDVTLTDGEPLSVDGEVAAPALSALALCGLALVGALTIAGPFFRFVLGAIDVLLGVAVVFSAVLSITTPVAASAAAISKATGIAGDASVASLVDSTTLTLWPWLALVVGVLTVAVGISIIVTSRRWPGASRKYQAVRMSPADDSRTSIDDWDSLSGGDDPTAATDPGADPSGTHGPVR